MATIAAKQPGKVPANQDAISTKPTPIRRFRIPREHGAWWTFASSAGAGLALFLVLGGKPLTGVALTLGMASIFLVSDWVSALSGAFLDEKIGADLRAWQPWALLALGLLATFYFAAEIPAEQRHTWASAAVGQAALLAIMFVLRQEMVSRDIRLLLLSSLLLTCPSLWLAAAVLGWSNPTLWEFWAWPALFYPAGVIYVKGWMSGRLSQGLRLSSAAMPYLVLAVLAGLSERWAAVALFGLIAGRAVWRIRRRLLENGSRIPSIREIRRFGYEQVFISLLFIAVWLNSFLLE